MTPWSDTKEHLSSVCRVSRCSRVGYACPAEAWTAPLLPTIDHVLISCCSVAMMPLEMP